MKVYLLLFDQGVMKLFQGVIQEFSHHILTVKTEREAVSLAFDVKSEK